MNERKFLVSVIMPVYNTEEYVETAIQSITEQSIGFEKNIQLILINDGSSDCSGAICRRYARLYPENIIYKKCHNHGVSATRNYGLKFATGEWVNFTDSDDKWDKEAFLEIKRFLDKHDDEIDLVSPRIKFFDGRRGYHMLDYKFEETRVVDVEEDYSFIQLHVPCWFRRDKIDRNPFNPNMIVSEDARYITDFLMEHKKYGVVREAVYLYRKRRGDTENKSAIQAQAANPYYYTGIFDDYYFYLINKYKNKKGELPRYIQYLLLYEIQWRLWQQVELTACADFDAYKNNIASIARYIDDDIIMEFYRFSSEQKVYLLEMKYGSLNKLSYENGRFYWRDTVLSNFKKHGLHVDCIECRGNNIVAFGRLYSFLPKEKIELTVAVKKVGRIKLELKDNLNSRKMSFDGKKCLEAYFWELSVSSDAKNIEFLASIEGGEPIKMIMNLGGYTKIHHEPGSYYYSHRRIIRPARDRKSLRCYKSNLGRLIRCELKYQFTILRKGTMGIALKRALILALRLLKKRPVWIISDRANAANDNGEALFRYLVKNAQKDVDVYFKVNKKTDDFGRLKQIGKVLNYDSLHARLMTAIADKNISSHIDDYVCRPFLGRDGYWLSDLFDFDIVFLQHGITKDDLSRWLSRYSKNIKVFIVSTRPEYNSVVNGAYLYDERQVKLTGFARHDRLFGAEHKGKTILISPTWRRNLAGRYDKYNGIRLANPDFVESDYYKFYDKLINDERICDVARRNGYRGLLATHPNHIANAGDFHCNDVFDVQAKPAEYSRLFANGALMVTDYSSVAFEFAYLNKPVIYAQFDRDSFFENHIYTEGYFSYENDGFGPVCYDYESTVAAIINAIENDCAQPKKYAERVKKTFAFHDNKNCERIYNEIMKLES